MPPCGHDWRWISPICPPSLPSSPIKQSNVSRYPRTPGLTTSSRNSRHGDPLSSTNIGSRNGLNYAIRTYIHQWQLIENFDDHDLEEIMLSKNALNMIDSKKQSNQVKSKPVENINIDQQRLNMLDLEAALSYMLRREVPRIKEIQGETYDALVHWLLVLTKVGPGDPCVSLEGNRVSASVLSWPRTSDVLLETAVVQSERTVEWSHRQSISSPGWYQYIDRISAEQSHRLQILRRFFITVSWLSMCRMGSLPYSNSSSSAITYVVCLFVRHWCICAWTIESEIMSMMEIPSAVKNFIKYFFGCRHCSENFMKETSDIHELDSKTRYGAVLYLWKGSTFDLTLILILNHLSSSAQSHQSTAEQRHHRGSSAS